MLACKFLRRQVFDVLRDQVRGRLKFVNRLVKLCDFSSFMPRLKA